MNCIKIKDLSTAQFMKKAKRKLKHIWILMKVLLEWIKLEIMHHMSQPNWQIKKNSLFKFITSLYLFQWRSKTRHASMNMKAKWACLTSFSIILRRSSQVKECKVWLQILTSMNKAQINRTRPNSILDTNIFSTLTK